MFKVELKKAKRTVDVCFSLSLCCVILYQIFRLIGIALDGNCGATCLGF